MMQSKEQINRAGNIIRAYSSDPAITVDSYLDALNAISEWRSTYQAPLTTATRRLKYLCARNVSGDPVVSQRLKRMPTIVDKLDRYPKMSLARMEDIGGCRAVVPELDDVFKISDEIQAGWPVVREPKDYIKTPKQYGYRAVHLVVEINKQRIEIQLRTIGQQQWADAAERIGSETNQGLKFERGSQEVLEWLRLASKAIFVMESKLPITDEMRQELAVAHSAAKGEEV